MPIQLQRSVFVAIPKTGSTWVRDIIAKSSPRGHLSKQGGEPPIVLDENAHAYYTGDLPTFLFVRDPVSWWHSYSSFCQHIGVLPELDPYRSDDLETWILSALGAGWRVSDFFRGYIDAHPGCRVGRTEALREDLARFAIELEEPLDMALIANSEKINVSDSPELSLSTIRAIRLAEGGEFAWR